MGSPHFPSSQQPIPPFTCLYHTNIACNDGRYTKTTCVRHPGFVAKILGSVPTVLHWAPDGTWSIDPFQPSKANSVQLEWFKVLLLPESRWSQLAEKTALLKNADDARKKTGVDAVGVYSKFLELLWDKHKGLIAKTLGFPEGLGNVTMDLIVTVPANWSQEDQGQVLKAVDMSEIRRSVHSIDISMRTEQAAAAIHILSRPVQFSATMTVRQCLLP